MKHTTLFVLIFVALFGCSRSTSPELQARGQGEESEAKLPPVALEIKESFIRGSKLHVSALLEAKTRIPSSHVAVFLRGLKEGQLVVEEVQGAREAYGQDFLEEGSRVLFRFELPAGDISEYQVACNWGEEARGMLVSRETGSSSTFDSAGVGGDSHPISEVPIDLDPNGQIPDPIPTMETHERLETPSQEGVEHPSPRMVRESTGSPEDTLSLRIFEIAEEPTTCELEPCDIFYVVHGELYNPTSMEISDIRLALGLTWVEQSATPHPPEPGAELMPSEEEIDLGKLVIPPGGTQKVRVRVDRAVPVLPMGRFAPHLRIVDYKRRAN